MKITLDLTQEECRILRDAINKRTESEMKYQRHLLRLHPKAKISNLLELSHRQLEKFQKLGKELSSTFLLTKWSN